MKLPRGVSADRLIRALERLGYEVIRQKGSHVRLRHDVTAPRAEAQRYAPLSARRFGLVSSSHFYGKAT